MRLCRLDQTVQRLFWQWCCSIDSVNICIRMDTLCGRFGLQPLPLGELTLCCFVAWLAEESLCFQSISSSYLSACRFYQIAAGLPDPSISSLHQLLYVLKGVRRAPRRCRLPITSELLLAVRGVWARDPWSFDQVMLGGILPGIFGLFEIRGILLWRNLSNFYLGSGQYVCRFPCQSPVFDYQVKEKQM